MIKSVNEDQIQILSDVIALHIPSGRFDVDLTYGNGQFYKCGRVPQPQHKFDIDPQVEGVVQGSSDTVPLAGASLDAVMFDPPFLTYVRGGRTGNGDMLMAKRFGGYWSYQQLENHYRATLKEGARLLKNKGVMVVKCQDIVHNHKLHATHINVVNWANEVGMRLLDLFVLPMKSKLPNGNKKGKQRHARIYHCYFVVLVKGENG